MLLPNNVCTHLEHWRVALHPDLESVCGSLTSLIMAPLLLKPVLCTLLMVILAKAIWLGQTLPGFLWQWPLIVAQTCGESALAKIANVCQTLSDNPNTIEQVQQMHAPKPDDCWEQWKQNCISMKTSLQWSGALPDEKFENHCCQWNHILIPSIKEWVEQM